MWGSGLAGRSRNEKEFVGKKGETQRYDGVHSVGPNKGKEIKLLRTIKPFMETKPWVWYIRHEPSMGPVVDRSGFDQEMPWSFGWYIEKGSRAKYKFYRIRLWLVWNYTTINVLLKKKLLWPTT